MEKNLTKETWNILRKMNLAFEDSVTGQLFLIDELRGGKHHYPSEKATHFSTTNALIFALVRSSTNLQICDVYMRARYLAKYAAGIEERSTVNLYRSSTDATFGYNVEEQSNEKISGVRWSKNQSLCHKRKTLTGKAINVTESAWWLLRFPYVCSNIHFIHVVTTHKEKRAGIVKERMVRPAKQGPLYGQQVLLRKNIEIPSHRPFTQTQEWTIVDAEKSSVSYDKITAFSARPPELLFLRTVEKYFFWFVRTKVSPTASIESMIKPDVSCSFWIDGFGFKVTVSMHYLTALISYCENFQSNNSHYVRQAREALECLRKPNKSHFINQSMSFPLVQVVLSTIVPKSTSNFLIHYLLSFGEFTTEIDLFSPLSLKSAFVYSRLIASPEGPTDEEVLSLTKRFVMEQLRFYPGSSTLLDRHVGTAYHCLKEATQNNILTFCKDLPLVLESSIFQKADEQVLEECNRVKSNLVAALLEKCPTTFPSFNEFMSASLSSLLNWHPQIYQETLQTNESVSDQRRILQLILERMNTFNKSTSFFVKHQVIVGPPGTGKSHVLIHCIAAAFAKGFNCVVTSLAAERGSIFGGLHINALIPFPVNNNASVSQMTSYALEKLCREPIKCKYLQRVHVLFIEEVSMVSAELWSSMDSVLQCVFGNSLPFGGKFLVCSGDFRQLPPPSGTLLLRSNTVLTCFTFYHLKTYVRMINIAGQRLLDLIAQYPSTESIRNEVLTIIEQNCNFVRSWCEVIMYCLRVFSIRLAEREAIDERIEAVRSSGNVSNTTFLAVDEMTSSGTQNWVPANVTASLFLNRVCTEPQQLFVHESAVLRLTRNLPAENLQQGQLCFVKSFDTNCGTITVKLAPPGFRSTVVTNVNSLNWREVKLRRQMGVLFKLNASTVCRRWQFPLKMYVASSVHKVMGDTVPMIATQITDFRKFKFWAKEQLYVLLSRVRDLGHITFVGDRLATMRSIDNTLVKENHLLPFINNLLDSYNDMRSNLNSVETLSPFPLRFSEIPNTSFGFC